MDTTGRRIEVLRSAISEYRKNPQKGLSSTHFRLVLRTENLRGIDAIAAFLQDPDIRVRSEALTAIGQELPTGAFHSLVLSLIEPDHYLRQRVIETLIRLDQEKAYRIFLEKLEAVNERDREGAETGLLKLTLLPTFHNRKDKIRSLLADLWRIREIVHRIDNGAYSQEGSLRAIDKLSRIRGARVTAALRKLSNHSDIVIADKSTWVLRNDEYVNPLK